VCSHVPYFLDIFFICVLSHDILRSRQICMVPTKGFTLLTTHLSLSNTFYTCAQKLQIDPSGISRLFVHPYVLAHGIGY